MPVVVSETIAEPANRAKTPWFNCDFILHFVNWQAFKSERSATACSVLPNALGAELFLVVEKATLLPTALELNGGGAFPIRHYGAYVNIVDGAIKEAISSLGSGPVVLPWNASGQAVSMAKAAFARLLVVGNDITFLFFPKLATPAMRGQRLSLVQRGCDRKIDCYVDGGECVCFDGWIRTEVSASERVLVSLPERAP